MNTNTWDYSKSDLIKGLKNIGLKNGDLVFIHISYGLLGRVKDGNTNEDICKIILDSFQTVLGDSGTLLVPTYTYSFCENKIFDVNNTPSIIGPFPEFFRIQKNVIRSQDPIFSVAGLGPKADKLLTNLSHTCFGKDSIYDRLIKHGGKICLLGLGLQWSTFRHHIEESIGIPTRFVKQFSGKILWNGKIREETWDYYVRHLNNNCYPDGHRLEEKIKKNDLYKISKIGRGEISCIDSKVYFKFGYKELQKDPWFTSKGPPINQ